MPPINPIAKVTIEKNISTCLVRILDGLSNPKYHLTHSGFSLSALRNNSLLTFSPSASWLLGLSLRDL